MVVLVAASVGFVAALTGNKFYGQLKNKEMFDSQKHALATNTLQQFTKRHFQAREDKQMYSQDKKCFTSFFLLYL